MSGGVDSSVAALLLQRAGARVIGLYMRLWNEPSFGEAGKPAGPAAAEQAARALGVPLEVVDLREEFKREVVDYLVREYGRGRTPNPCLACNRVIKFGRLLDVAGGLGAGALATGHYVRTEHRAGRWHLLRARDRRKDQSYVLFRLGQRELALTRFPLGELSGKDETRRIAAEVGLPTADEPESQEICFIADDDYRRFLQQVAPEVSQPGPILDRAGREIGRHAGLSGYTIGQRKGLGIAAAAPLYVLALDVERNAVIAGPASELGGRFAHVEDVAWVVGEAPAERVAAVAKIRYQAIEAEVEIVPTGPAECALEFARQQRDITPGQGVVFYAGDEVLGGGIIASAQNEPRQSILVHPGSV